MSWLQRQEAATFKTRHLSASWTDWAAHDAVVVPMDTQRLTPRIADGTTTRLALPNQPLEFILEQCRSTGRIRSTADLLTSEFRRHPCRVGIDFRHDAASVAGLHAQIQPISGLG